MGKQSRYLRPLVGRSQRIVFEGSQRNSSSGSVGELVTPRRRLAPATGAFLALVLLAALGTRIRRTIDRFGTATGAGQEESA